MDTRGRLVAGSHNRNEFVLINADEVARVRGFKNTPFFLFTYFLDFWTPICSFFYFNTLVLMEPLKIRFSDLSDFQELGDCILWVLVFLLNDDFFD